MPHRAGSAVHRESMEAPGFKIPLSDKHKVQDQVKHITWVQYHLEFTTTVEEQGISSFTTNDEAIIVQPCVTDIVLIGSLCGCRFTRTVADLRNLRTESQRYFICFWHPEVSKKKACRLFEGFGMPSSWAKCLKSVWCTHPASRILFSWLGMPLKVPSCSRKNLKTPSPIMHTCNGEKKKQNLKA